MNVQILSHNNQPTFVVIPYADYQKMLKQINRVKEHDEMTIPNDVVSMYFNDHYSLIKAWRIYLKKTPKEVAEALGIGQPAYSQIEKSKKCQRATLEKIAAVFGVEAGQLTLED